MGRQGAAQADAEDERVVAAAVRAAEVEGSASRILLERGAASRRCRGCRAPAGALLDRSRGSARVLPDHNADAEPEDAFDELDDLDDDDDAGTPELVEVWCRACRRGFHVQRDRLGEVACRCGRDLVEVDEGAWPA